MLAAPPLSVSLQQAQRVLFKGPSISLFLVSAGQQMPSRLEVEETHGDVTPPALQGGGEALCTVSVLSFSLAVCGRGFQKGKIVLFFFT